MAQFNADDAKKDTMSAVGPPCSQIRAVIRELGPLARDPGTVSNDVKVSSAALTDERDRTGVLDIRDLATRDSLQQMASLHRALAQKVNTSRGPHPLLSYFGSYYMRGYVRALEQLCYADRLPLPSAQRMQAAANAIAAARFSVVAISVIDTDYWHTGVDKSVYVSANVEASQRGVQIRRLAILRNDEDLDAIRPIIQGEVAAGIALRVITRRHAAQALERLIGPAFTLVNVLICDDQLLSVSSEDPRHEGALSINSSEIAEYRRIFEALWELSSPLDGRPSSC
jgi:hypothetical protein